MGDGVRVSEGVEVGMAIYSHSQLSIYEECPLKYKLRYWDGIRREIESEDTD